MAQKKLTRRSFFKTGSSIAGLIALPSALTHSVTKESLKPLLDETGVNALYPNAGRIAIVYHPNAVSGSTVDFPTVQYMFDQGIMQFTGITSSPAAALASLFPGLTTSKKIAIKPNLLNSSVPTRKELVKAVITRLVQMLGGFPAQNITLYERHSFNSVGYTTSYFGQSVKLVVDSSFPDLGYYIYCNGRNRPYSKSLHDADYLINMPVLKDHSCSSSFNVTLAFKNHMGTVNPDGSLAIHCDKTAVLDIMKSSVMTTKQVLVIMDGLYAVYNGGPGGAPQATPKKIFISQDPVTNDYQGRKVINELRQANGLNQKSAGYIEEAANAPYSIGIANPNQMTVLTINMPVELRSFGGSYIDGKVNLHWITEKETTNYGFSIERSADGTDGWHEVGFVKGNGTTGMQTEYHYTDILKSQEQVHPVLHYRLKQIDTDGKSEFSFPIAVAIASVGKSWKLEQNYPNPFNASTEIPVELSHGEKVVVDILDAQGKAIERIHDGILDAGSHHLHWDASRFSTGIYTCRANVAGVSREIKMILMK